MASELREAALASQEPLHEALRVRRIYEYWYELVSSEKVHGKAAHDARLVAAMKRHSLTDVLTFNPDDFARCPDIRILDPLTVASHM